MRNHIAYMLAVALSLTFVLGAAWAETPEDPLPPELQELPEILDDEAEGLELIRRFDRAQTELARWDFTMARQHFDAGEEDAAEAKMDDARHRIDLIKQAYEKFLEAYPENAKAHNHLGELIYDFEGDEPRGLALWQKALELDPDLPMPHNNLAIHLCHGGQYEDGFRHLDRALELDPENPDFLYNAVQIYFTNTPQAQEHYGWDDEELYAEGMRLSKKAMELSPEDFSLAQDYAVNFFGADRFGVEPDWNEAADAWERARGLATRQDDIFMSWLNEGRAAMRAEDYARVERCLEKALEIHPDSGVAQRLLEEARQAQAQ